MKIGKFIRSFVGQSLSWLYVALVILPLVWVILTAFRPTADILRDPIALPTSFELSNFDVAWNEEDLGRGFVMSLQATAVTMLLLLPMGCMTAYALTKYRFKGSQSLLGLFSMGLMFPNMVAAVPLFLLLSKAGWHDTLWGLVAAYVAYSLSFTIFVMSGFFAALPDELAEAATLDGCGHFKLFSKIMMPLARPGLVVVAIFNALGLWNEYNLAKVVLFSDSTISVRLADLITGLNYKADFGAIYAGSVIVMMPVILIYWLLRERVQEAMLAGAIK